MSAWGRRADDEVAVDRVLGGATLPLNLRERREVVRRFTERGQSADWIAHRLGIAERTVVRHRRRIRDARPWWLPVDAS